MTSSTKIEKPEKEKLEKEFSQLKEINLSLENTISKLKEELITILNYNSDTKKSIFKIRELEEDNLELKQRLSSKELDNRLILRQIESKYEMEISKLKSQIQLINHKYDAMMRYEIYINKIEEINTDLTKKNKDLEDEFQNAIKNEQTNFDLKLATLQQKTLNILSKSKKQIHNSALENMNNTYKLVVLQVHELNHQLSEQSAMLEELLKQMNKKDRIIQSMKINSNVYKEVEKVIITQNRKLCKLVESMLDSKGNLKHDNEYDENSKVYLAILKNEKNQENFIREENRIINIKNKTNKNFFDSYGKKNLFLKNENNNFSKYLSEEKNSNTGNNNSKEELNIGSSRMVDFNNLKKFKVKSFNSSTADDINSTCEFGNTFVNSSIKQKKDFPILTPGENMKKFNSSSSNFMSLPKTIKKNIYFPNENNKILNMNKFLRNSQILDKYELSLSKPSSVLGLKKF